MQQMPPCDCLNLAAVKELLKEAYEVNMFDAYELMKARTWKKGESIDGYASSLLRLAEFSGGVLPQLLMAAFVSILLPQARNVIRYNARSGQLQWSDAVSRARQIVIKMGLDNAERCLVMEDKEKRGADGPTWE